jgi:hypothetical protein
MPGIRTYNMTWLKALGVLDVVLVALGIWKAVEILAAQF